jgi:arylsulfatase A-like enzyme
MIHFPNDEFAGQRIDTVVSLVDIMPTIFEYLGRLELCTGCRGISLLDMLKESDQKFGARQQLVSALRINEQSYYRSWKEVRGDVNIVIRQAQWKGIWNVEPGTFELYRLDQDPGELSEQSSSHPQLAQQLREQAATWFEQCKAWIQTPKELDADELDPVTVEKLRSLGYFN